ncbi:hypothetical protein Tco_1148982 [Tanacetum coccineum]
MRTRAESIPTPPTSAVRNTVGKKNEQTPENPNRPVSDAALWEYCDKHYHQLLPLIAEKVHQEKTQQDKLKEVKARLNFEGCSRRSSKIQEVSQHSESRTPNLRGEHERRRRSRRSRIPRGKRCLRGWEERKKAYSIGWEVKEEVCPHARVTPNHNDTGTPKGKQRAVTKAPVQEKRNTFPESVTMKERLHREHKCSRKVKIAEEDTGSQDRKNKSQSLKKTTYPNHGCVKKRDPEDHLKIFQAAAKVERWAMPTWCHIFNSTLTGSARVWFDD